MAWYDREEEQLADAYASGLLSLDEYNKAMRQLQRDIRAAAEEEAAQACRDTLDNY